MGRHAGMQTTRHALRACGWEKEDERKEEVAQRLTVAARFPAVSDPPIIPPVEGNRSGPNQCEMETERDRARKLRKEAKWTPG